MRNILMAVAAAGAMAVSTSAFGQATVVPKDVEIDDLKCGFLDAAGAGHELLPKALGGDAVMQAVLTDSGNSKFTCHGTLPDTAILPGEVGYPNNAVLWDFETTGGGLCNTIYGSTEDWHMVVTKSGKATLTCHLNVQ